MTSRAIHRPLSDPLKPVEYPELVIGLVGPVGSNLSQVTEVVVEQLSRMGYGSKIVRVSSLVHDLAAYASLEKTLDEFDRITEHMDAGNEIRRKTGHADAMALLSVGAIRNIRRSIMGKPDEPAEKTAYILRSLKNPEEIHTLRKVYGKGFFAISTYLPRSHRCNALAKAIARKKHVRDDGSFREKAESLIARDEEEVEEKFGQNVRNTFPLADAIINAETLESIENDICRFVEILFGNQFRTPTIDEYGMYFAKAAALRSADLSRQVGAAILTADGEIVSAGCNEVPKADGGQYWSGDENDTRDFKVGEDSNYAAKRDMLAEILDKLKKEKWLRANIKKMDIDNLVNKALDKEQNPLIAGVQLMDILEFGRVVHAEMAAIAEAARLGRSVKGTTLYCTTFPCHICARHIVAAGVKRVVYVEPYPKSMAADLYPDSISVDHDRSGQGSRAKPSMVHFDSFAGISPQRYIDFFSMTKRKDQHGKVIRWDAKTAKVRLERLFPAYIRIEAEVVSALEVLLQASGLKSRRTRSRSRY